MLEIFPYILTVIVTGGVLAGWYLLSDWWTGRL